MFLTRIGFLWFLAVGAALAAVVLGWKRLISPEGAAPGQGWALAGLILGLLSLVFGLAVLILPLLLET